MALFAAAPLAPREAAAFCGFFVSGADARLTSDATMVVLMREGTRTVLSMANSYAGPPEDFAMVVPVPVVLRQGDVKTLPAEVFARVDQLAAPRLVEYWEQDPCPPAAKVDPRAFSINPGGGVAGLHLGGAGAGSAVVVEAQFAVGEYEVVILGASDSLALDGWLRSHGYRIPEGARRRSAPTCRPG